MSAIVYISEADDPERWRNALIPALPEADLLRDFHVWPDGMAGLEDYGQVDIALVWRPEPGVLMKFPNLKAIINLGAGVDSIVADQTWPRQVPLVRMVDPALTRHMSEFILHRVLHFHRKFHIYEDMQRRHDWRELPQAETLERRIGILGMGELGGDAARHLVALEFKVAGWSRSEKHLDGVESFFGADQLPAFLGRTEILVCLLPLTPETTGIIDATTLGQLPKRAFVINAARGGHVVEADLLAALDSGHIEAAALDVFQQEPLPDDSPFWNHPKVVLSPHIASLSVPKSSAAAIAENIRRVRRGEPPRDLVELDAGY